MAKDKHKKMKKDYEVGYGRPPKKSQFQKGQSGNPSGRPKEPTTFIDSFNKVLSKDVKVIKDGKEERITGLAAVCQKYLNSILGGEYKFIKLFIDKIAKDVDIKKYLYPDDEEEAAGPPSEAVQEIKSIIKLALKEKLAKGETLFKEPTQEE